MATGDACVVCLEPLDAQHTSALAGCGHVFHSQCIVNALQHNRACPLCRYQPEAPTVDYADTESEEECEESEEDRALRRRRSFAIRSSLMRFRRGSASDAVRAAARDYSRVGAHIQSARVSFREANREIAVHRRVYCREIESLVRQLNRGAEPARRRWVRCRERLHDLEATHRSIGDVLASAAGFTAPSEE